MMTKAAGIWQRNMTTSRNRGNVKGRIYECNAKPNAKRVAAGRGAGTDYVFFIASSPALFVCGVAFPITLVTPSAPGHFDASCVRRNAEEDVNSQGESHAWRRCCRFGVRRARSVRAGAGGGKGEEVRSREAGWQVGVRIR